MATSTPSLHPASPAEARESTPAQVPEIIIQPSKGWVRLNLRELWQYRDLIFFLGLRDIQVRYKQTAIGVLWAIIQPFMTMVVFSLFFGGLAKIPSDGIPYPVFSFAALVPWGLFASGLTQSSNSLVGNANLLRKVYFPRLIIPLTSVIAGIVDFFIAFIVLLVLMLFFGIVPTLNILFLPLFVVLALLTSLSVGLWLSALNVRFRDVRYVVPFLVQFWMFATPIAYPSSLIQNELLKALYGLNPMAGVIEGFRWALFGTYRPPGPILFVSMTVVIALLIGGLFYFRRMEKTFADIV